MKHSVSVFFAWHGLESCWRLGVVEPDQSIVFYGLESCWRSGVVEPDQLHCFLWVPKVTWGILSACFLLGMGSTHAGVRLFRNRSFVFYGFQRWREAFCLRVFCLAWARILLVFRSFRIWRWRDFEQPSFGIHVSNGFLLGRGWRSGVSEPKLCFLWVPKVTWSILSACFLLGMGSNLAGVSVFSNLTLTRLWAAIVRNPFLLVVICAFRIRFFAWQRLDCCWRSGVSEPKLCFLWAPKVTWSILSACFLRGMGSNLAGVSVFSNLTLTRLWAAIVRNPRFERFFLLGRGSTAAGVRVFRNRSFVFYGFQRWCEAFCLHVFCLAWAWILLVFRSFRIWRWRDFEQPSFGIHGVRVFLNRIKALFFILFFYLFLADNRFQRWREAFCQRVFCLAWARYLAGVWVLWNRDAKHCFLWARIFLAFGCLWSRTKALFFMGSKKSREAFFRRVFCLAWARLMLAFGCFGTEALFFSFRIWRWRGLWAAIVRNPRRSGVPEPDQSFVFQFFFHIFSGLLGSKGDVKHFCQLFFCLAWARILLAFGCCGTGPKHCFLWARYLAGVRVLWSRTKALFFMCSKSHVRHSFGVFFAWHGLDSCWRSVVSEPKLCYFMGFQRWREAFCLRVFLLGMGSNLAGVSVFSNLTLTRLWAGHRSESTFRTVFCLAEAGVSGVSEPKLCYLFSYGFQRWREAFCLRVFCLAWARILLVFRSFRIWRWRDFEQPSFGIHVPACGCMCVSNGFLLGRGSTAAGVRGVSEPKLCFCLRVFCLAWARILLVFSVFSNLTLTRIWVAIVRNPRSCLWLYMCVSNVLFRHPFWCTNRVLRALILLVFRSFRIYSWQNFDSHRQESTLVFICIYLYYIYNISGIWAAVVNNPRFCLSFGRPSGAKIPS